MTWFWNLNLIHFLDFYLMFMFMVGTARRLGQYRSIGQLVLRGPGRWPLLLNLVSHHRTIFLTWTTVWPALLALALMIIQLVASRMVWPEAGRPPEGLSIGRVVEHWGFLAVVLPLGLAMLAFDLYSVIRVGRVPHELMEKYFDQAEYWLRSRNAHVVRVFTFGFINPRKMVAEEVQKSLIEVSNLLNRTLWSVNIQVGLRFCFGLALWLTWALTK